MGYAESGTVTVENTSDEKYVTLNDIEFQPGEEKTIPKSELDKLNWQVPDHPLAELQDA